MFKGKLGPIPPFAIISPNKISVKKGLNILYREYEWGKCETLKENYSDLKSFFVLLTNYLVIGIIEEAKKKYMKFNFNEKKKAEANLRKEKNIKNLIKFGLVLAFGIG